MAAVPNRPATPGTGGPPATAGTTTATAARIVQRLEERVKADVQQMRQAFWDMVGAAKADPTDKSLTTVHLEQYQVDLATQNMVRAAQSLLSTVAELRQIVLLYDLDDIAARTQDRLAKLQAQQHASLSQLAALRLLVEGLTTELERVHNCCTVSQSPVPGNSD